ncbi:MAG TPA: hypothetical protein VGO03_19035 [Acidimicrobiia bacterium]
MGKITDLLHTRQFQAGLVDGILALAVVLACSTVRVFGRRPPIAGAVFAFAGFAALTGTGPGRRALAGVGFAALIGVLLLLGGGAASRALPPMLRMLIGPLLLAPGSVVLALAARNHGVPWWEALLLIVVLPPSAMLAGDFDRWHSARAYGPLLLAITVGGVYLVVPDTEGARALLGVALPFVLLTVPWARATLGMGGAAAAIGLIGYDVLIEGVGRPGSVIGALGCVGLFVYEPIGRRVAGGMRERARELSFRRDGTWTHLGCVVIAASLHLIVVLWASRVAGRVHSASLALLLLLPAIVAGIIASPLLPDPNPRPRGPTNS